MQEPTGNHLPYIRQPGKVAPKGDIHVDGKLVGIEGKVAIPNNEEPIVKRTTHRFLHPTKGWRQFSRPGKTNRRRKLIRTGVLMVPNCHAYRKEALRYNPSRAAFRREMDGMYHG